MSVNDGHYPSGAGVVLFFGERLLVFCKNVKMEINLRGKDCNDKGSVYLTSHRLIWINNDEKDSIRSLCFPFCNIREFDIKQPIFGANKIVGKILPIAGNQYWNYPNEFSMSFHHGGAIEFGKAIADLGKRTDTSVPVQPYRSPQDLVEDMYASKPPPYTPPYQDPYYGFITPHSQFVAPDNNYMYQQRNPPPYPGAVPSQQTAYAPNYSAGAPPMAPPPYGQPQQAPPPVVGAYYMNGAASNQVYAHAPNAPPYEPDEEKKKL